MITCIRPPYLFIDSDSSLSNNTDQLAEHEIKHIISFDNNIEQPKKNDLFHLLHRVYGYTITHFTMKHRTIDANNPIENDEAHIDNFPQIVRFLSRAILKNENVLLLFSTAITTTTESVEEINRSETQPPLEENGDVRAIVAILSYMIAREHLSLDESIHQMTQYLNEQVIDEQVKSQLQSLVHQLKSSQNAQFYRDELERYVQSLLNPERDVVKQAQRMRQAIQRPIGEEEGTTANHDNSNVIASTNGGGSSSNSGNGNKFSVCMCQKCRFPLFDAKDLVKHTSAKGAGKKDFSYKKMKKDSKSFLAGMKKDCNAYYIERKAWMDHLNRDSGDINCPKCSHRIGAFAWSGVQCSCGVWVRPAIQILKSRVDVD